MTCSRAVGMDAAKLQRVRLSRSETKCYCCPFSRVSQEHRDQTTNMGTAIAGWSYGIHHPSSKISATLQTSSQQRATQHPAGNPGHIGTGSVAMNMLEVFMALRSVVAKQPGAAGHNESKPL